MKNKNIYPWVVVALLWFVAFLNYMDRQMLSTMQASMKFDITELQNATNFGRLMAVFLWIYGFMSPIAGILGDRINRKYLIIGSIFVFSGVTLLMGYATTFNQLYALRAVMGLSEALYLPVGLAIIADYHQGKTRSLAIGIHMTGLYCGQAIGGFGATIANHFSWQTTFHWFGIIGITYSIILMLFFKEQKEHLEHQSPAAKTNYSSKPGAIWSDLAAVLSTGVFWAILFMFATPSFPGWATKNWLPTLFANNLKLDMSLAGPLATITIALSSFIGVITGGLLSDKWIEKNIRGRIFTSAIGMFLMIPSLFFLGYGHDGLILCGGIFFGVGFGMFDANNMPILCQFIGPKKRATAYGMMNMTGVFAGAAITNLLGKSTDSGHLGHDFALLSIPVLLALIVQLVFLRPKVSNQID